MRAGHSGRRPRDPRGEMTTTAGTRHWTCAARWITTWPRRERTPGGLPAQDHLNGGLHGLRELRLPGRVSPKGGWMAESDASVVLAHGAWAAVSSWGKGTAGLRSESVKRMPPPPPSP